MPKVASQSQNGTGVSGPRLDWPAFLGPRKPGQTKRRSGSIGTLNTRPSSPLLCRLPAYMITRYDTVPLSDSGRPLSVLPNHDCCQRPCHHGGTMRSVIAVHTPRAHYGDDHAGATRCLPDKQRTGFCHSAHLLLDSVCTGRALGCPTYAVGLQTGRCTP